MDSFKSAFEMARYQLPWRDMLMRYNNFCVQNRNICVVEGPSDVQFYKNSNIEHLNGCNCNYVWHKGKTAKEPDWDQEFSGKQAVIRTYFDVLNNLTLSTKLNRTIFLVDRDYDDKLVHMNKILSESEQKCFTMTFYHSLECYFLSKDNIEKLFRCYHLNDDEVSCFLLAFNKFCSEIMEYFSLKSAIVACYNYGWDKPSYKKTYEDSEVFDLKFDSDSSFVYNRSFLDHEVARMRNSIVNNIRAEKYCKYTYERFMSNHLFMRGHTLFEFLYRYLLGVHNISFDYNNREKYEMFISQMHIPLDIKNGKGIVM